MAYAFDHANKKWRPNRITRHGATFVEVHKIGWLEGRTFKTYLDATLSAGQEIVIKVTHPIEIVIQDLQLDGTLGTIKMETFDSDATPSGSFTTALPNVPTNDSILERPQPFYTSQMSMTYGGSITGGTKGDIVRVKTGDVLQHSVMVGNTQVDVMFKKAGTCYVKITAETNCQFIFKMRWEERLVTAPL